MGYVLAHLLLWTGGLVRDNVAMAEGLLGLLTEFARRRIRTPRVSRETLASSPLMFSVVLELKVGATLS